MRDQYGTVGGKPRHADKVADRIVAQILANEPLYSQAARHHEHRITVGRRMRRKFTGDNAAGAGTIVDNDSLSESFAEFLPDHARNCVVTTARRKADDEAEGFTGYSRKSARVWPNAGWHAAIAIV